MFGRQLIPAPGVQAPDLDLNGGIRTVALALERTAMWQTDFEPGRHTPRSAKDADPVQILRPFVHDGRQGRDMLIVLGKARGTSSTKGWHVCYLVGNSSGDCS